MDGTEIAPCQSGSWKKAAGGGDTFGAITSFSFGTDVCPGKNAFVYAHKQSSGVVGQGVAILVNGSTRARSTGQSEGHLGYESASLIIRAGECFRVNDVGGGTNRYAWYRSM